MNEALMSLLPLDPNHKQVLAKEVASVITGTFAGMVATALAQGILIGIGYWIAGIDNPLVWGVVAIGVTLIPVIGGPVMYIPPAIALIIGGSMGKGIFLLIWGVAIVSMADNVIKPDRDARQGRCASGAAGPCHYRGQHVAWRHRVHRGAGRGGPDAGNAADLSQGVYVN